MGLIVSLLVGWPSRLTVEPVARQLQATEVASQTRQPQGLEPSDGLGPPQPTPAPERDFDIVATGDLLIHQALWEQALSYGRGHYDFRPFFADVRPIISGAALALCHVETPLQDGPPASYPMFRTPVELATAIRWAGWDGCDTASNHTLDRGQAGVDSTIEALNAEGVAHTGSYRSAGAARRILMFDVQGVKVAYLAYTHWTNGMPLPHPWSVNLISIPKVEADAARARALGADLVIANFHWGDEYSHQPNQEQTEVATELLKRHVLDVVLGQHVHVVQPIERMFGGYAVFGEGNFLAAMLTPDRRDGLMAVIHVHAGPSGATVTGVDYIPVWMRHPDYVVEPVGDTLRRLEAEGEGGSPLAADLRASYARTVGYAGVGPGIHPVPRNLR